MASAPRSLFKGWDAADVATLLASFTEARDTSLPQVQARARAALFEGVSLFLSPPALVSLAFSLACLARFIFGFLRRCPSRLLFERNHSPSSSLHSTPSALWCLQAFLRNSSELLELYGGVDFPVDLLLDP